MGLFTKYQLVCTNCGMTFQSMNSRELLCDKCKSREKELKNSLRGYENIRASVLANTKPYGLQDFKRIDAHRREIMDKHPSKARISQKELRMAGESYQLLTETQAMSIIDRASSTEVGTMMDACCVDQLFFPLGYEGTVVDVNDVFAISIQISQVEVSKEFGMGDVLAAGMATLISEAMGSLVWFIPGSHGVKMDVAKCVAYTCDPYMPMFLFSIPLPGKTRILSKKNQQEAVGELLIPLHTLFPKLIYEIQLYDDFKKLIQKEKMFRKPISIDPKTAKSMVSYGFIISSYSEDTLPQSMTEFLASYGYYTHEKIMHLLWADAENEKDPRRKFWEDIIEKVKEARKNGEEIPVFEFYAKEPFATTVNSAEMPAANFHSNSQLNQVQKMKSDDASGKLSSSKAIDPSTDTPKMQSAVHSNSTVPLQQVKADWFCPKCGKKNNRNFCSACGQKRPQGF